MSSCLAITSTSSDRPPSGGGGACCAIACTAAHTVAKVTERTGGTRRAPARIGLAIEFLFVFGVRSKAAAAISWSRKSQASGGARDRNRIEGAGEDRKSVG